MVPETRRSFLHGATALAALFAGCGGESSSSTNVSNSNTPVPDGPQSGSASDPETLLIRRAADDQPLRFDENTDDRPQSRYRSRYGESAVIDSPARADRLTVGDDVDRDRLDSFLAETDFEAETLYLETIRVDECFRLDLCHISWQSDEISTDYTRQTRPYTEACAVDTRVSEARLIRIPDTLDADEINGYGSSVGTGVCRRKRGGGATGSSGAPSATGSGGGEAE